MSDPAPTMRGMTATIDYTAGGPLTDLSTISSGAFADLPEDPVAICRLVNKLVIQPHDAERVELPPGRFGENQIRPAARLVGTLLTLDPSPLTVPRPPERRVIGTCRHFAVLACALLRHRGIAARARCGFATYFQPGLGLDHWVVEFSSDGSWVRADPEAMGLSVLPTPEALVPGQFLTGGEAWAEFRAGRLDPAKFGVRGTENFGPAEIRGNAIRDLASLNRVETLPWDEWGRMEASYQGRTGADYDALLDTVASVCATGGPAEVAALYESEELRVPSALIS
jgi:hypothetical protein